MSGSPIFAAASMAVLALLSVGLWTLRVALTARGRTWAGASVAAMEATVFALVFARLVSELDEPARVGGYASGVALGTLLGMAVDRRLARSSSQVRIVIEGRDAPLVGALRERGWPATALAADGLAGPATMVLVAVGDRCLGALVGDLRELAPRAFWTVERLHDASRAPLDDCVVPHVRRRRLTSATPAAQIEH